MRLWSYQGMAHGADGLLFFQWRASRKGPEKFHSGMVPHVGENSRTFREICELGSELPKMKEIIDSDVQADVAIVLDYNSWWTVEDACPNYAIKYLEMLKAYHYPLFEQNITTDIVPLDRDLSRYKVVVAPYLYMVKPGFRKSVETFVSKGGTFITTFFSGVVDETEGVFEGGYPGPFTEVLGLKVEEFDALKGYMTVRIKVDNMEGMNGSYDCKLWAEVLQLAGAKPVARYMQDYYQGQPAITVNSFGSGKAYYLASQPGKDFMKRFLLKVCRDAGVSQVLEGAPENVEATIRKARNGAKYLFLMNHNYNPVETTLPEGNYVNLLTGSKEARHIKLRANDAAVLRQDQSDV
jgi:beta-galactosidase